MTNFRIKSGVSRMCVFILSVIVLAALMGACTKHPPRSYTLSNLEAPPDGASLHLWLVKSPIIENVDDVQDDLGEAGVAAKVFWDFCKERMESEILSGGLPFSSIETHIPESSESFMNEQVTATNDDGTVTFTASYPLSAKTDNNYKLIIDQLTSSRQSRVFTTYINNMPQTNTESWLQLDADYLLQGPQGEILSIGHTAGVSNFGFYMDESNWDYACRQMSKNIGLIILEGQSNQRL